MIVHVAYYLELTNTPCSHDKGMNLAVVNAYKVLHCQYENRTRTT
jgi:hypothetical protein